jgi:hypothetical protein
MTDSHWLVFVLFDAYEMQLWGQMNNIGHGGNNGLRITECVNLLSHCGCIICLIYKFLSPFFFAVHGLYSWSNEDEN